MSVEFFLGWTPEHTHTHTHTHTHIHTLTHTHTHTLNLASLLHFPSLPPSPPSLPLPSPSFPFLPLPSPSSPPFPFLPLPSPSFPFLPLPSPSFPFLPLPALSRLPSLLCSPALWPSFLPSLSRRILRNSRDSPVQDHFVDFFLSGFSLSLKPASVARWLRAQVYARVSACVSE